ncbi:MAG: PQQ-binding-like beta-propeller repeat protein [Methanoregulaceae archaeon]|jgi:outer membrane protein assembly factor BamB
MKPYSILTGLLLLMLIASAGVSAAEQGWKFRADLQNTGVYDDGGTRPDGTLLWSYPTGDDVDSSPAIVDGVVYIGGHAFDARTGERLWWFREDFIDGSSPAVSDGVIYIGSDSGKLYAVDAATGTAIWNFTTGAGVHSSPAVADGIVYFGSKDHNVYALDSETGTAIWNFTTGSPVFSSPAVVDGVVYIGSCDKNVYALDAQSGELVWNYTTGGMVYSSPAVVDGHVHVGSFDGCLYVLHADTGEFFWSYAAGEAIYSTPAVADGIIYFGCRNGFLYALNTEIPGYRWSYHAGQSVDSSPAVANGVVYFTGTDYPGNNGLFALDAATGALLWKYNTMLGTRSSPAVADGTVYFGSADMGSVFAIGASPGSTTPYDDFDDNVCNSTLWDVIGSGGPYVTETNQRLEITLPADSSGDTFSAGYSGTHALRGDFDVQIDYQLLTWPENSGVRAGLWVERSPTTFTIERVSYSISDFFTPGDHYTTNFADSILLSATNDTQGTLRLVRTGTAVTGYCYDESSHDWVLLQGVPESVVSTRDVTFRIMAWGHDYSFGDEPVRVAFDNFVINKGELVPFSPPTGVTSLQNATYQPTQIRWTWMDPGSIDFDHVMVYLDGEFQKNVTKGVQAWTAKGLLPSTAYTIGIRTVGEMGAINGTWVNHTATTSSLLVTHLDPPDVMAGSPGFTLGIFGSGFGEDSRVLWNGDEQPAQFHDEGHLSIDVLAGMIAHPAAVNITVHDGTTGEVSNPVAFRVRDQSSGVRAWKFRSNLANTGVYDDGGVRPGNELLWKSMTESYVGSSPAVVEGVVYICGIYDINAIDALTGKLLWTSPDGGRVSSPAVADNVVYVGNYDGDVSALDASTGDLLWQYTTGGVVHSSPALADGIVYVGSQDWNLYALDAGTGTLLWNYTTGGEVRSSPAIADGIVYFGSNDHRVYALDANTGALIWNYATGGELSYSSPAVSNGILYIQSNDGNLYALDTGTGDLLWDYPVRGGGDSCPAVEDGMVYIGSDDGNLYALNAHTGDLVWKYATGNPVRSSPAVANGIVYFGNYTGSMLALDARVFALDAGTGDLLWEYTTDEMGFSSPAIANGVVYIQGMGTGYLYALATLPDDPPASVTGVHPTTINGAEITWAWTDPAMLGFSYVMVSLDGVFQGEVEAGRETWTATNLAPSTAYTIGIRTVGKKGAINGTWVTHTATTGSISIASLDPAGVVEDDPAFTLNVYGTGFTPACHILWNGAEQATQYLQPDRLSMDVPPEYVAHSRRVTIAVHDPVSGESSNAVILPVTDNPATAMARKFRSDLNNSGVYDDGGRSPAPTLLWTYTTALTVSSSPSIVDGTVYIGSLDRNLYALDATTGVFLWKYDPGERNDYVSSSPAVSNGVAYIGGLKYKIHAVDAYSGELLWNYKQPIRTTMRSSVSSSAAVADGVVFIGNMDGTLYAFSEETGDLLWNHAFTPSPYDEHRILSSPAVAGGVVYVNTYGGGLYALDASTGAVLWNYRAEGENGAYSSPAVADGVVYVGSGYINKKLYAVDALTGDLIWDFTTGGSVSSSPAVANGVVFFGSNDNTTYALDATTGDLLWNFTTGDRVISSPAVANGVVYFGSYDNTTYALDASTGSLIWSYATGGRVTSSPAVANGIVYFGCGDGNVYALRTLPLDPPVAAFTSDVTSGDAPLEVLFSDTSTGIVTTRSWDFGDGTTAWANGTQAVTHTYTFPGSFTVSLTAGNQDGEDTVTRTGYIQVRPSGTPPRAWFAASPMMGYEPLAVRFTDRSVGMPTGWQWDFGDGSTASEKNPVHTYTAAGRYTITLRVTSSGGSSSYSSFVWVREEIVVPTVTPSPTSTPQPGRAPIALFTVSRAFGLAPTTVQFTDRSFQSPASWHWDFGDGNTSVLQNPANTFTVPGTYPVSLTVANAYGESTTVRRVYVR